MGWPLIFLALAVTALPGVGQASARTFFEDRILDRAPIIVRARFDSDQSCFDVDVAAFRVIRAIRGQTEPRILVLGASAFARRGQDVERLLFLEARPSGCLYRIVDVVEIPHDPEAVEAFLNAFLQGIADTNPARRRAALKASIKDGLGMRAEFPRKLAVFEFDRLARRTPAQFSQDELAEVAKAAQGLGADERERLLSAIDAAEGAFLRDYAGVQAGIPRGPARQQFLRLVQDFLRDSDQARREPIVDQIALRFGGAAAPFLMKALEDPAARSRAALHLGAMQWSAAAARIAAILAEGPSDAEPLIASLGEIGSDASVASLARYLSDGDRFDAAVLALARIGTPGATRTLDAMAVTLGRDPRQAARVAMMTRVRSREFLEEDAARRAEARGRYPRE